VNKKNVVFFIGYFIAVFLGSNVSHSAMNHPSATSYPDAAKSTSKGTSLTKNDMAYYNKASQGSLEANRDGQESSWTNPDNGHSGLFTPIKTYQMPDGTNCREYKQTLTIELRTEKAVGAACRQRDGSWQYVSP
jgi:surface antigen